MSGAEFSAAERQEIYAALWSAETHVWCADLTGCPHCQEQERKVLAVLGPVVDARVREADKRGRRDEREQHILVARAEAAEETLGRVWALHRPITVPAVGDSGMLPAFTRCSCTPGLLFSECPTATALAGESDG